MPLLLLLILVYAVGFTGQFLRKFFFLAFPVREEIGPLCWANKSESIKLP